MIAPAFRKALTMKDKNMKKNFQKTCFASVIALSCISTLIQAQEWYTETLYDDWRQTFRIDEKLYEAKTKEQHLVIFKNATYGTVLALDGIIQTTEKDEYVYHEMMAHVPMIAHGNAQNVLIIGGGDGGAIREVLKHKTLKNVTLVEIDEAVITFSKNICPLFLKGDLMTRDRRSSFRMAANLSKIQSRSSMSSFAILLILLAQELSSLRLNSMETAKRS